MPRKWRPGLRSVVVASALLGALFAGSNARAAATTYTVNALTDTGTGSGDTGDLRYALTQAEAAGNSGSTINITATGTITLTSNLPAITQSTTINGPAAGDVTISGAGKYAIFQITSTTATVTISGVTIANGSAASTSGGILNDGSLTVNNITLVGNSATGSSSLGGGITNNGTLSVTNSTFVGNSASAGGGISNGQNNTVTVLNSTFTGNSSNAIKNYAANAAATLTVVNSILTGDTGTECVGNGCPTNGSNGNVVGVTAAQAALLPLGNYGGTTLTVLPQPGSAAICAGTASPTSPLTLPATDQRGFALNAANCSNGGVDAGAVQTSYLTVMTVADSDDGSCTPAACSLRDAITAANATGADIAFKSSLAGSTITLSSALPAISNQVNIVGPGANQLAISGNNSTSVGSVLTVNAGATVSIYGLTIEKGATSGADGGGINNSGTVTVINSTITANAVGSAQFGGGGIFSSGTLTVLDSTISGNTAVITFSDGGGGGIAINSGSNGVALVTGSTISGNTASGSIGVSPILGGGIDELSGTLVVTNSTISGNTANSGGGIYYGTGGSLANSIVAGNTGGDVQNSYTDNGGNLVGTSGINLTALGNYGGSTQTMLPEPGSPAICAGVKSEAVDANGLALTTDQRGFPVGAASYCASGSIDAGAVQTDYTSAQFTNDTGYSALINQVVTPAPILSITENGQNVGGIPVTLTFTGAGTNSGLGPVTTVAGTGATFSSIKIGTAGASDTLSISWPVGTKTLSASANLEIDGTVTLSPASGALPAGFVGTAYTTTLTASGGKSGYSFSVSTGSTLPTGLALKSSTGVLSGTPTIVGNSSFAITVTDSKGHTGSASYTLAVNQASTLIVITSKDGSAPSGTSYVGDSVTFTASISPVGPGVAFANGVSFTLDGNPVSACTAQPVTVATSGSTTTATATCVLSTLSTGSHTVSASYPTGDSNYGSATSAAFTQTVNLNTTAVSVIASGSSTVNAPLKFTAVVTDTSGNTVPTAGTVMFASDGVTISGCGAVTLAPGSGNAQASCSTSSLTKGSHNIVATYSGDSTTFAGSSGSLSQTVNSGSSTVTLVSSPNPSISLNPNGYHDQVALTATIGPSSGAVLPTGTVTFTDNGAQIPECQTAVPVSSGTASCITTSLTFGSHTIVAAYSGDNNFTGSNASVVQSVQDYTLAASPTSTVTVGQRSTNLTDAFSQEAISVSATPIAGFTGQLALTCSVVPVSAPEGAVPPTCILGSSTMPITASAQQQPVSVTIDAGTGSNPVATTGSYNVSITGVDSNTGLTRTSAAFVVNIRFQAAPITIVSGATTGNTSTVQFSLPPNVGITSIQCVSVTGPTLTSSVAPIALSMGCSFSPSTIAAAATSQDVMVTVTVSTGGASTTARLRNDRTTIAMAGMIGVPLLLLFGLMPGGKSSRKMLLRFMGVVFAVVLVLQGIGCGGGQFTAPPTVSGQTPPGSYNILVEGTGTDHQLYQAVIQVNVTR